MSLSLPEKKTKNKGIFRAKVILKREDKLSGRKKRVIFWLFAKEIRSRIIAKHDKKRVRSKRILLRLFR